MPSKAKQEDTLYHFRRKINVLYLLRFRLRFFHVHLLPIPGTQSDILSMEGHCLGIDLSPVDPCLLLTHTAGRFKQFSTPIHLRLLFHCSFF